MNAAIYARFSSDLQKDTSITPAGAPTATGIALSMIRPGRMRTGSRP